MFASETKVRSVASLNQNDRSSGLAKRNTSKSMMSKPEAEIQFFDQKAFMDREFLERKFDESVFIKKRGLKYYDIKEFYFDI
jgi:hypothetical protein